MSHATERKQAEVVGFVGVGLDNKDGHQRITRCDDFLLLGGSAVTHEHMQDTALRFQAALARRGKRLAETSVEEAADLLRQAMDS